MCTSLSSSAASLLTRKSSVASCPSRGVDQLLDCSISRHSRGAAFSKPNLTRAELGSLLKIEVIQEVRECRGSIPFFNLFGSRLA